MWRVKGIISAERFAGNVSGWRSGPRHNWAVGQTCSDYSPVLLSCFPAPWEGTAGVLPFTVMHLCTAAHSRFWLPCPQNTTQGMVLPQSAEVVNILKKTFFMVRGGKIFFFKLHLVGGHVFWQREEISVCMSACMSKSVRHSWTWSLQSPFPSLPIFLHPNFAMCFGWIDSMVVWGLFYFGVLAIASHPQFLLSVFRMNANIYLQVS